MRKREKIIAAAMVVLVLFYAGSLSKRKARPKAVSAPVSPTKAANPRTQPPEKSLEQLDPGVLVELIKLKSPSGDLVLVRDPFVRPVEPQPEQEIPAVGIKDLALSGIVIEEPPMALINGQLLQEGDSISGYQINEIRPNEVILDKDGESFFLHLSAVPDPAQTFKEPDSE